MGEILRYGAYLPQYRAPLGEIQKFYGRPGRPRAKALCTPALDEDALTMAYEASVAALDGGEAPGVVITVSQSPPFGLRKLSATLARTLGLDGATALDLGGLRTLVGRQLRQPHSQRPSPKELVVVPLPVAVFGVDGDRGPRAERHCLDGRGLRRGRSGVRPSSGPRRR